MARVFWQCSKFTWLEGFGVFSMKGSDSQTMVVHLCVFWFFVLHSSRIFTHDHQLNLHSEKTWREEFPLHNTLWGFFWMENWKAHVPFFWGCMCKSKNMA